MSIPAGRTLDICRVQRGGRPPSTCNEACLFSWFGMPILMSLRRSENMERSGLRSREVDCQPDKRNGLAVRPRQALEGRGGETPRGGSKTYRACARSPKVSRKNKGDVCGHTNAPRRSCVVHVREPLLTLMHMSSENLSSVRPAPESPTFVDRSPVQQKVPETPVRH